MKAPRTPDDDEVKELRNWLKVARKYPTTWRGLVDQVQREWKLWLPPLIFLAAHEGDRELPEAVKLLDVLVAETPDVWSLCDLLAALPGQSSVLARLAADVTSRLLEQIPEPAQRADLEVAKLWNNLSERCQNANRPEDALRCAQQAVALSRAVPGEAPSVQRVQVVTGMTLAKRQAERGANDLALQAAALAFDLASKLALSAEIPDQLLEAQASIVLANRWSAVGDCEQALAVAAKARQFLAQCEGDQHLCYDVALLEHFLSTNLTRQGRHEEALPLSANADRLFRQLAGTNPDEYQEYKAAAAYTYATNLTQTGNLQRAYDLSLTAVDCMAPLVARQPLRFGAEHIVYLVGHSDAAAELGEFANALKFAHKAILAARRLGRLQGRRDWYLEGQCQGNRFRLLYRLQRFAEARAAIRAALRAFNQMSVKHPEAIPEQARALRNLAEVQRMTARAGGAAAAVRTSRRALARLLGATAPATQGRRLLESQCRTTLANCLEEADEVAAALVEDQASLGIRRELFAFSALVHRPDLAYCLLQTARRCLQAGRLVEAASLAAECVGHYETIGANGEEEVVAFYGDALRVQADTQAVTGDFPGALQNLVRGMALLRPRYAVDPELWLVSLLPLCARYVELCGAAGVAYEAALVEDVIVHAQRSGVGAPKPGQA